MFLDDLSYGTFKSFPNDELKVFLQTHSGRKKDIKAKIDWEWVVIGVHENLSFLNKEEIALKGRRVINTFKLLSTLIFSSRGKWLKISVNWKVSAWCVRNERG